MTDAALYWSLAIAGLDAHENKFNLLESEYDSLIQGSLATSQLSPYLNALRHLNFFGDTNDYIVYTSDGEDNLIVGGSGNDYIYYIYNGNGNDILLGGAGNDTLTGGSGSKILDGGAGDDYISAEAGSTADGGLGTDYLSLNLSTQTANLPLNAGSLNVAGIINARNFESFNITAGSGNDSLIQSGLVNGSVFRAADTLTGGAGNDTLNAGLGVSDYIDGGEDNDLLILDYSIGDTGQGMYFAINGGQANRATSTGSTLDSVYFGNIERFQVTGTAKDDNLTSGGGDDTLIGGAGNDYLTGDHSNNWYGYGGTTSKDSLVGGAGDDTISAGVGDTVDGGTGSDRLYLNLYDQTANLTLNAGSLNIPGIISATNFESFNITAGSGNDSLIQSGLVNGSVFRAADTLTGGAGNDTLNAGLGVSDYIDGGEDNDLLILDYSIGDTGQGMYFAINGGQANRATSTGSTLDSVYFNNIERFQVTGTSQNDDLTGGAGDDTLIGGAGNDYLTGDYYRYGSGGKDSLVGGAGDDSLNGGLGNDTLNGGTGNDSLTGGIDNDTYVIDSIYDTITENANEGTDTVQSSITYTLGANLENLTLTGTTAINGTGNSLNNSITGNNANNTLNGDLGNDTLNGGSGNDILNGGDGNDSLLGGSGDDNLVGGIGNDTLTGGTGSDRFTFNTLNEGIDRITDFLTSQGDKIAVSASGFGGGLAAGVAITAEQFVLGTTSLDASDRFIYNNTNGNLFYDADGIGSLASIQIATLSSKPSLAYTDILVLT